MNGGGLLDGVTVRLGRRDFIVPPLSLRAVRKVLPLIPKLGGITDEASIDAAVEVMHLAITRNYPNVTREEVEDLIDLGNMQAVVAAVMAVSGFVDPKAAAAAPEASP